MKSKMLAIVFAMFCGSALMASPLVFKLSEPFPQRFVISKYGTLQEIFDANGKSRFGKIVSDGFDVTYEVQGTTMSASAKGEEIVGLHAVTEDPKLSGTSATAILETADQNLKITSRFILDENAGKLVIERRFSNLSKNPLTLQIVRDYVDPVLVIEVEPGISSIDPQLVMGRIAAGLFGKLSECGGNPSDCPVKPPCPRCTEKDSDGKAQVMGGDKTITLQWPKQIKLAPSRPRQKPNEAIVVVHVTLK